MSKPRITQDQAEEFADYLGTSVEDAQEIIDTHANDSELDFLMDETNAFEEMFS